MNLIYIIPKKEDLWFRKKLIEDQKTMEFNKDFGGIVPFPKEKWDTWYNKWINSSNKEYFYSYIYDNNINQYVGEIAYRKDKNSKCAIISIIINHKHRGKGYGKEGLKKLVSTAFKNGFNEVKDDIAINNTSSQKMFQKFGFKVIESDDPYSIDHRMTKDEYIKRYSETK